MDFLRRAFGDTHSAALTLGVGSVAATHVYMLLGVEDWDEDMVRKHAMLNLTAAAAILYGSRLM